MRIGFAIPALDGGGAEFVARQWADALNDGGHRVCAYTFDPAGSSALAVPGATHRHFPFRSTPARWLLLPLWLRRQAHRDRLDVLVTMLTFSNLVGIAGLRLFHRSPVPLAITEHGMTTAEASARGAGVAMRARHWLARRLYRRSDAAIAVSHPVATDLTGRLGIDAARTFVVPNPVLRSSDVRPGTLPEKLNVAFVGRLDVEKRPLLFVDTLAVLAGRGLAVRGTVLGRGPMLEEVRDRGEACEVALDFRGWREPWWDAAADVDCLLVTSSFEGFGNVCVEAAAARIPTVASSTALGVGDAVVPGLTGSLVVGSEPGQLADGVLEAVRSHDVDPMRGWLNRFSVEASTALLLEVLSRLAQRSPGGDPKPS